MPQRETRFTVNAPPPELWKFIRDIESLCTCIPGVEKIVLLDERSADLTVKEKIGVIPMVLTLRAIIESEDPPRRLHATAKAEHLTMNIDVSLEKTAGGTELRALFDVAGTGQLKPIVDRLFEKRATERAAQFADCLQQRFGAAPPAGAPAQVPRGWLSRTWRRLLAWLAPWRD
jgi:carbon monoxide dehydrogenase subunit G